MKRFFLALICFFTGINVLNAQTLQVSGVVIDETDNPVIGATILVKETQASTSTDINGRFKISVPNVKSVLRISYVGYTTVEVPIKSTMEIKLVPNERALSEVVVTGIFNKPKESYTGAAVMVTAKELQEAGSRNLVSSIANVAPGFRISENNIAGSNPNAMPYISLRGTTNVSADLTGLQTDAKSIAEANIPLIVLNGFEISLERMMDLDENQIESITILKDANATAMYGTRGSNGVIVITTRKPEIGRLRVTYKGTMDIQAADLNSYNLMNSREKLEFEKQAGLYAGTSAITDQEMLELYNDRLMNVSRGVDTYWIKYPVHNGIGHRHNINIEGGTETIRYGGSVAYRDNEGAMRGNKRNTFNGNLFLQYNVKNFSFQNDLYITEVKGNESPYGTFSDYTLVNQYFTPYDESGNIKKKLEDRLYRTGWNNKLYNPLYNAMLPSKDENRYTQIDNNFSVEWRILPEFFVRGKLGISKKTARADVYKSAAHTDFENYSEEDYDRKGTYTYTPVEQTNWETQFTANYSKKFKEKHSVFGGLGINFDQYKAESYSIKAEGLSVLTMDFLGQAAHYEKDGSPSGIETTTRSAGMVFNGTYSYDNRYTFDFNGKYEGSSKFGKNNRYSYFGSTGAGWNLHNEHFLTDVRWLDYARFRISYGVTGDPIKRAYQSLRTYTTTLGSSYQGWYGVYINSYGNPDLKMARSGQFNIGLDWEVLDKRVKLSADFYQKRTKDMILSVDLPTSAGFSNYYANVGKVTNKGFELSGTFTPWLDKGKKIRLDVGGTMSHVKNRLEKISNSLEALTASTASGNGLNPSILYQEGKSINTIYAVKSKGIDPATGNEIFVKKDGSETFIWDAADRVDCGATDPKLEGSLNLTARYRGFNLTAYFYYRLGGQDYNTALATKVENIKPYQNADRRALYDRWKTLGETALYKSISNNTTTKATSRFVMDNDIFQLSSINLGYDVPTAWSYKHLCLPYVSLKATLNDIFYTSTIKRERGTDSPFSRLYTLSLTIRM